MVRKSGTPLLMIELAAADYRLAVQPERGGSIAALTWRGETLLRATCGPSVLDTACFPLVPFSNRIANGRFRHAGGEVVLTPNLPGSDHPHPLHGFGWLTEWQVVEQGAGSVVLSHDYPGGEWPWPYHAEQAFSLSDQGLTMAITLENRGSAPMPAGLGFHPYFPCESDTIYRGLHRGEWQNSADCLPVHLDERDAATDWWQGRAVGLRSVDTVYTERQGDLRIIWPQRGMALTLTPSENLPFTVVYTPEGEDFFCVEPVSHMTDAVNHQDRDGGMLWLAPGEVMRAELRLQAEALPA